MKIENIDGYPGYYVTPRGHVYSKKSGKWVKRKLNPQTTGRLQVRLISCTGRSVMVQVSRLVALAYLPNPHNKPCVCHRDNNKSNNRVDNLYWGTHQENMDQRNREGRCGSKPHYGDSKLSKLTDSERIEIIELYREGNISMWKLSKIYGVGPCAIYKVIHSKHWNEVANLRRQ